MLETKPREATAGAAGPGGSSSLAVAEKKGHAWWGGGRLGLLSTQPVTGPPCRGPVPHTSAPCTQWSGELLREAAWTGADPQWPMTAEGRGHAAALVSAFSSAGRPGASPSPWSHPAQQAQQRLFKAESFPPQPEATSSQDRTCPQSLVTTNSGWANSGSGREGSLPAAREGPSRATTQLAEPWEPQQQGPHGARRCRACSPPSAGRGGGASASVPHPRDATAPLCLCPPFSAPPALPHPRLSLTPSLPPSPSLFSCISPGPWPPRLRVHLDPTTPPHLVTPAASLSLGVRTTGAMAGLKPPGPSYRRGWASLHYRASTSHAACWTGRVRTRQAFQSREGEEKGGRSLAGRKGSPARVWLNARSRGQAFSQRMCVPRPHLQTASCRPTSPSAHTDLIHTDGRHTPQSVSPAWPHSLSPSRRHGWLGPFKSQGQPASTWLRGVERGWGTRGQEALGQALRRSKLQHFRGDGITP